MTRNIRRAALRAAKETGGAAAVEFALMVWPFLALALGGLQLFLVFLMNQSIQTVAVQVGREYMTGQQDGASQAAFHKAVCDRLPSIFNCTNVFVDVQTASTASGLNTAPLATAPMTCSGSPLVCTPNTGAYTGSAPLSYAILRVEYDFPVIGGVFGFANQPNSTFLMVGTSVFQVEPYPTS